MPAMLGAQLDDLIALAGELARTTSAIGDSQQSATSTTDRVVESVRTSSADAERQIANHMAALRDAVTRASTSAEGALWTGTNAETFRQAYREFDASLRQAEEATKATFADFGRAIAQMSDSLSQYSTTLASALASAQSSTQSMETAVRAQRDNLDQVMNSGLTVG